LSFTALGKVVVPFVEDSPYLHDSTRPTTAVWKNPGFIASVRLTTCIGRNEILHPQGDPRWAETTIEVSMPDDAQAQKGCRAHVQLCSDV